MSSRVLEIHQFLLDSGVLEAPLFDPAEAATIADLEHRGILEDPERFFDFVTHGDVKTDDFWLRDPIDMRTFMSDPYYAGPAANALYPVNVEIMVDIFEGSYSEVILGGSIGYGKTYMMAWGMFRQLYELSCLRSPQSYLGIAKSTPIVMLNLSVTGAQARNACYGYVKALVDGSHYFAEHFERNRRKDERLEFPQGIVYQPGNSSEFSAIGSNTIAAAVDEANFLVSAKKSAHEKMQNEDVNHALSLYRALASRIETRFRASRGWKGRLFLASSRVYEGDFLDQQITEKRGRDDVKIVEMAHWDAFGFAIGKETRHPHTGEVVYSGKTFTLAVGRAGEASRILEPGEVPASDSQIVYPPIEYLKTFTRDMDGSIRNIAGLSLHAINPFFRDRTAINAAAVEEYAGVPLRHPFSDDMRSGLVADSALADLLDLEVICEARVEFEGIGRERRRVESMRPRRRPDAMRYVHFDLAKSRDAVGMAMAYVDGIVETTRDDETADAPMIVFELLANIIAPRGGVVLLHRVREIVYRLRDKGGVSIGLVTADRWQSLDLLQIFDQAGITTDEISVDVDSSAYAAFRDGVSGGWVKYYAHETLLREMRKVKSIILPGGREKVDHPEFDPENPRGGRGSKDLSDAAAGVVKAILKSGNYGSVRAPEWNPKGKAPQEIPKEAVIWNDPNNAWVVDDYIRADAARYYASQDAKKLAGKDRKG